MGFKFTYNDIPDECRYKVLDLLSKNKSILANNDIASFIDSIENEDYNTILKRQVKLYTVLLLYSSLDETFFKLLNGVLPNGTFYINIGGPVSTSSLPVIDLILSNNIKVLGRYSISYPCFNSIDLSGVEEIDRYAGANLGVDHLTIPKCVKSIGEKAFIQSNINSLTIESDADIPNNCFNSNIRLTSLDLKGNIKNIGYDAFNGCTGLKVLKLPDSVEFIADSAFYGCDQLTDIYLPKNLKTFNNGVFMKELDPRYTQDKQLPDVTIHAYRGQEDIANNLKITNDPKFSSKFKVNVVYDR